MAQDTTFIGMHLMCLGVIWVGVSATALVVALALYGLRMLAITGFYHRAARAAVVGRAPPTSPRARR